MDEDGIVLARSAPGRPEEGQIERLTGHESVVTEVVTQETDLIGEGRWQEIIGNHRTWEQSLGRWGPEAGGRPPDERRRFDRSQCGQR